ncbi:MAG: hypothetical protein ACREO7_15530 [Pseudoxanthomonas sp.]
MESLGNGIKRLGQFQVDALKGGKEQNAILDQLGISAGSAETGIRDANAMLRDLADIFEVMPDGANKTALAVKLFGKSGADLIPLLNGGSKSLDEFAQKSDLVGYTLTEKTGKGAEAVNDLMSEFRLMMDGIARQALPGLLPKLQEFGELLNSQDFRDGFQTIIGGAITAGAAMLKFAADTASTMKFLGESVAAKINGPNLEDLVRSGDEIERITKRIDVLRKAASNGGGGGRDGGDLGSAFFSNPDPAFIRDAQSRKGMFAGGLYPGGKDEELKFLEQYRAEREKGMKLLADMRNTVAPEAAALALTPPTIDWTGGDPKGGKGRSGKSDAARQAEEAARAMREAMDAQAGWHDKILDMAADLEGPTATVLRDYDKSMADLTGQFNEGKVRLDDYAKAQDLLAGIRDKDLAAIKAQLTPFQEVNAAIAEQALLLGMSGDEQEIWNNLKWAGVTADSEWGKQIIESTKQLQEQRDAMDDQIEVMDALRDAGKGLFRDIIDDPANWKNAVLDALDSVQARILDMIAQNWMDQLFGKQGQPAGGSTGGFDWAGLIGSFFGGAKAGGGDTIANRAYLVGEHGPEMFVPRTAGTVLTAGQTADRMGSKGRGITNNNTFHLAAPTDLRSQDQIAQKIAQTQRMAEMRNR